MSSMLDMMIDKMKTNQIQQTSNSQSKESAPVNIVNQMSMNLQQPTQTTNKVSVPKQDTIIQDTFEKNDKDKTKKIIKYSAIGTGIAVLAYSLFALVKYRNRKYYSLKQLLTEPIKEVKARLNPYGFKPKTNILENDLDYFVEVAEHVRRLKKSQQANYIRNLYETSQFNEQAKDIYLRHFSRFFNN